MFDKLAAIERTYDELTQQMTDNEVISDQSRYTKVTKQHRELEPHDTRADTHYRHGAARDLEGAARADLLLCELPEEREQPGRGIRGIRRQIGARKGKLTQPVIGAAAEAHHFQMSLFGAAKALNDTARRLVRE